MADRMHRSERTAHDEMLDRRVAEMRRMLAAMKPSSASDALKALRDRFPDVPLSERMQAFSGPDG